MNCHKTLFEDHFLSVVYFTFLPQCEVLKKTMVACCNLNTFIGITEIDKIALKSILIEIQNILDMMLNMSVAIVAA